MIRKLAPIHSDRSARAATNVSAPKLLSQTYRVSVGHSSVLVHATTATEAIERARIALSVELPRLYDVIHSLAADRFRVTAQSDATT